MMMKLTQKILIVFTCMISTMVLSCSGDDSLSLTSPQVTTQARLLAPLSQALNLALQDAQMAKTPEEARQLAQNSFFKELTRLLKRQFSANDLQLQVQSQWTASGKIQLQLQAQISESNITAQAQRQSVF